jgi:hypothetical protein
VTAVATSTVSGFTTITGTTAVAVAPLNLHGHGNPPEEIQPLKILYHNV